MISYTFSCSPEPKPLLRLLLDPIKFLALAAADDDDDGRVAADGRRALDDTEDDRHDVILSDGQRL